MRCERATKARQIVPIRAHSSRAPAVRFAQKKKVAEKATFFSPAYGHTGSRRCRTDLGGHGGASVRTSPQRRAPAGVPARRRFFAKSFTPNAAMPAHGGTVGKSL